MIELEEFDRFAHDMVMGMVGEMMDAMKAGTNPLEFKPGIGLRDFVKQMWLIAHPDNSMLMLDLTEQVNQLAGCEGVTKVTVRVVYETATKRVESMFCHGSGEMDVDIFSVGFNDMMFRILVDEHGFDPEHVKATILDNDPAGSLGPAFKQVAQDRIDREVEKFREEIDSKIDSLFGRGGDDDGPH